MRSLLWLCAVLLAVITLGDCAAKHLHPHGYGGDQQKLKQGAYRAEVK